MKRRLLLLPLLLSACAGTAPPVVETRVQVERVTLPSGLLSCSPAPALGDWSMQSGVARYIVRLNEAYIDCRDTVGAIAGIESGASAAGKSNAGGTSTLQQVEK